MVRTQRWLYLLFPLLPVTGCASSPVPPAKIAAAEGAIDGARREGAQSLGGAAGTHLRWAEDQLSVAKTMMKDGDTERAARVFERSEADAVAAQELARSQRAKITYDQVRQQMKSTQKAP